jgi:hypothetical protein
MALVENVFLGLLFILLVALLLSLIVYGIIYLARFFFSTEVPAQIVKILWAIVGVICLAMLIALLFAVIRGVSPYHPFRSDASPFTSGAAIAYHARPTTNLRSLLT